MLTRIKGYSRSHRRVPRVPLRRRLVSLPHAEQRSFIERSSDYLHPDRQPRVRKAAWHTLDDGGNPNDPRLQPLLEKIAKEETDPKLRQRALDLIAATRKVEEQKEVLLGQKTHTFSGRCDWCGASNVPVSHDYETEFETSGTKRFALVCEACETA